MFSSILRKSIKLKIKPFNQTITKLKTILMLQNYTMCLSFYLLIVIQYSINRVLAFFIPREENKLF